MCLLWTAVATTMLQQLKLLKDLLGVYLNRRQGMAFLERVQASNLSDTDRALVTRIIRATLKLPDAPGQEPSLPAAPDHTAHTSRRRHRRSA
jgi:hypothetical protein